MSDGDELEEQEAVFELADWTAEERKDLSERLQAASIAHEWEQDDLVVAESDADAVDDIIEAVEYPDELAPAAEGEDDGGAGYAVMSDLFVTTDRLQRDPDDPGLVGQFFDAAEGAADAAAPFGVAPEVWQQVQELSAGICEALDGAVADDVVARDAAALRQLLSRYV